jgi:MFS family permease
MRRIPRGVWLLGFVSLFMDVSSEMVHALLPVFLVTRLGASMLELGLIEGVAEATASMGKVVSGILADRPGTGRRKRLALLGYGLAALTKPLFAVAPSIGWIFLARFTDRVGKAIRGAPRDALLGEIAPPDMRGACYGLRQSLDTVGAFSGPLLAMLLMAATRDDFRQVFWVAFVPAVLSVLLLFTVREPEGPPPPSPSVGRRDGLRGSSSLGRSGVPGSSTKPPAGGPAEVDAHTVPGHVYSTEPVSGGPGEADADGVSGRVCSTEPVPGEPREVLANAKSSTAPSPAAWRDLGRGYWILVAVSAVLTLARFSEAFLVMRAQRAGLSDAFVPLVLVTMNVVYAFSAWPVGALSDRTSRRALLAASLWPLFVGDLLMGLGHGLAVIMVGIALWGLHMGMSQGLLSAMVADASPSALRGSAFGFFYLITGAALLLASFLAGLAWTGGGPGATFLLGAGFTALTLALVTGLGRRLGRKVEHHAR